MLRNLLHNNYLHSPAHISNPRKRPAFTLIEVLVVVAIIALLAAILLPSLSRAREQAKIASCIANAKQIAGLMATYQSEYKGYVPIVFGPSANGDKVWNPPNYQSDPNTHNPRGAPAKMCYLSLAFQAYDKGLRNLRKLICNFDGTPFDPDLNWPGFFMSSETKTQEYEDKLLPNYYICPFSRDGGKGIQFVRTLEFEYGTMNSYVFKGRHECYSVWRYEQFSIKNRIPKQGNIPVPIDKYPNKYISDTDGRPKYSAISWSTIIVTQGGHPSKQYMLPGGIPHASGNPDLLWRHRLWSSSDARRLLSSSLSDLTASYCSQGYHMGQNNANADTKDWGVFNADSHRTGNGAGTIAFFADTHVKWVKGMRIGWTNNY
ncbi:MAG: prepilin-type N-terminal cleavage/methylation domain-containing protein [Planctomycetota bacterium]|nr:MAG: prepilin-type N-terminal cleavage/methylation domain-containing protein [Planctomycetota bacterium]